MYLKRLEISGFKSFAKKTELLFDSPITSIVGPNGSGKSNVAEAFRWVLGEQSLKSLRGKRGEDLIFNGGHAQARLNRASVSVAFDNKERKFDVDFDEVVITREVFRDGTNEYKINGSQVRLRDIIELLSVVSLGQSGHHIISQGEADRILTANVAERRTMIEEALGLKIYQWKIEESERKLEKTEENIKQVESLQREIAPHIKFLRKQVEKIEKTAEMRRELKSLYLEYLAEEHSYLSYTKEALEHEIASPKKELAEIEDKTHKLSAELSRTSSDDKKNEQLADLERKLREARSKKDELSRQIGRIEGVIEIKEERLKTDSDDDGGKLVPFSQITNLIKEVSVELENADRQGSLEIVRTIISKIRSRFSSFLNEHSRADAMRVLVAEVEHARKELKNLEEDLAQIEHNERTYVTESSLIRQSLETDREATRGAERELFELKAKRSELRSRIDTLHARGESLALEDAAFKRELGEAVALTDHEVLEYDKNLIVTNHDRAAQEVRRRQVEKLKIRLEDMGIEGTDVIEEFKKATEREEFLARELEDLIKAEESLKQVITDLQVKLDVEFKEGIEKINKAFQQFFALMFDGGNAALEVVAEAKRKRKDTDLDLEALTQALPPEEDTKEGIEISVNLPRKKVKGLQMLSGGERALTSIALLFAMSQVNPPPFLILDETDAALDEANSRKYGEMIVSLSKYSQLILITHNRETMSRAGVLYGVTMGGDGMSRLLSIKFDDAQAFAK